ncbi:Fc.00g005230.m01.CDS01 [Cosmosporella sp. VM-42]
MPLPGCDDLVEYSLEVDFMVAREQPRIQYARPLLGTRDRWACPHDELNPARACMEHCAKLIEDHGLAPPVTVHGGVAISDTTPSPEDEPFDIIVETNQRDHVLPRHCYWFFCPSTRALPRWGSPKQYDWVPITLRSPYRRFSNILPPPTSQEKLEALYDSDGSYFTLPPLPKPGSYGTTEMERCLALLRAGMKIHANSTCEVRIHLNHRQDGLKLTDAKKMVTWMWLQEQELFRRIRPDVKYDAVRPQFFTQASKLANRQSLFPEKEFDFISPKLRGQILEASRPFLDLDSEIMDTWVPEFIRARAKERVHFIWSADTLEDLADMISVPNGESTIAINVHGPRYRPTFEFRYALWHPQKESMQYWLLLIGRMFLYVVGENETNFKQRIRDTEKHISQLMKEDPQDRWKTMMVHSGHNVYSHYWQENFVKEYGFRGALTPEKLDRQGILDPVEGIDYVSRGEGTDGDYSSDGLLKTG